MRIPKTLLTAGMISAIVGLGQEALVPAQSNPNSPGVLEPALTATTGRDTRVPHTDQVNGGQQLNVVGQIVTTNAEGAQSLTGHQIQEANSPNDDMKEALEELADAAENNDQTRMVEAAQELLAILEGTTQGRIYDGFAMLNYNRGAFVLDHVPGEYKMKVLQDTGETEVGIDGVPRKIWEVAINMLWYDGQFDSDTFLLRIPIEAHEHDTLRVHWRIYSLEREEFAPTTVMLDHRLPGSVAFPFKGEDSVWVQIQNDTVTDITVSHPPLRLLRGVYTWGWRVHPPRIQFVQPVFETVNAHTGQVELEPQGESYAFRNRQLSIDGIGDAAPEKKMYIVAKAVLNGASPFEVSAMLTDSNVTPSGTWQEWADLAKEQRQLPPEAWDMLAQEGISRGNFGPYKMVTAFMNNEMYGDGPNGNSIEGWNQGDTFHVKLINLDNHTHYFRNVDFGAKLHDDIQNIGNAGSHSFEIMNFKPTYGAPKVAEAQWRAGWGFRPHFDVIQQQDVFPRASDQALLTPFKDGEGNEHLGYQYSAAARGGDFRFNPPPFIIASEEEPSSFLLTDADGNPGLVVGQLTEGYGVAQMCPNDSPGFCSQNIAQFNPNGVLNWPPPPANAGPPTELRFPPFLRNPAQGNPMAGDIIPPTPAWKPFLWINPNNGTLFIDPEDPDKGFWADLTYSHGAPVPAGGSLNATIEAPRSAAQVFYQFDDLFHDNDIFSPHPTFAPDGDSAF